jgi:hypothetical protein
MLIAILLSGGLRLVTLTADGFCRLRRLRPAPTGAAGHGGADARSHNNGKAETNANRTET